MSTAVVSVTAPLIILPDGVARSYDGYAYQPAQSTGAFSSTLLNPDKNQHISSQYQNRSLVLNDLKNETARLFEGIKLFDIPDIDNLYSYRSAISSSPENFMASAGRNAALLTHSVKVGNLAAAQTNQSRKIVSAQPVEIEAGAYEFELDVSGDASQITVDIEESGFGKDVNRELLEKISRQIEAADGRIESFVKTSTGKDENNLDVEYAALVIRSKTTGEDVSFKLRDISGDLVETLSLDRMAPAGMESGVAFNHQLLTSATNSVTAANGDIQLKLLGVTGAAETLAILQGPDGILLQSDELFGQYNKYVDFLHKNRDDIKPVILNDIMNEIDKSLWNIRSIGISPQGYGTLNLTPAYFQALLGNPRNAREVLTGDQGFLTSVGGVLENVLNKGVDRYAQQISATNRAAEPRASTYNIRRTGLIISGLT